MNTLKEKITILNNLVLAGRPLEAFEKFYHPDILMQENENAPTVGKEKNRLREEDFFSKAKGFYENARVHEVAVDESAGVSMVKWSYNYHHDEWGHKKYTQVSVQQWKNGQIIKEQFFYGN